MRRRSVTGSAGCFLLCLAKWCGKIIFQWFRSVIRERLFVLAAYNVGRSGRQNSWGVGLKSTDDLSGRIAESKVCIVGRAASSLEGRAGVPLYLEAVPAGFPSPAEDYVEGDLDLNEYLVRNPAATFMVRVQGDSMIGAGIHDGDVLVVDRSREAAPGKIVVAVLDGELTVKRLARRGEQYLLEPENPDYAPIVVENGRELFVWGVVTGMVRRF